MGGNQPRFAAIVLACLLCCPAESGAVPIKKPKPEPSFMHGLGQVVGGVLFELPKTVIQATLDSPPVLGPIIGIFAGTARALQTTTAGLIEMSAGFKPFSADPKR